MEVCALVSKFGVQSFDYGTTSVALLFEGGPLYVFALHKSRNGPVTVNNLVS